MKLFQQQFFIQIGSSFNEIIGDTDVFQMELYENWPTELLFQKNSSATSYYSPKLHLIISGIPTFYSQMGDVVYFPEDQTVAILLGEEIETVGEPRIFIGRLRHPLSSFHKLPQAVGVQMTACFKLRPKTFCDEVKED